MDVDQNYPPEPRTPGALKGQIEIADDFDETPEEIASAFVDEDETD